MSETKLIKDVYDSDLGDISVSVDNIRNIVSIRTRTEREDQTGSFSTNGVLEINSNEFVNIIKAMEGVLINRITREQIKIMKIIDDIEALLRDNKELIGMISNGDLRDIVVFEGSERNVEIGEVSTLFDIVQSLASYYLINNV